MTCALPLSDRFVYCAERAQIWNWNISTGNSTVFRAERQLIKGLVAQSKVLQADYSVEAICSGVRHLLLPWICGRNKFPSKETLKGGTKDRMKTRARTSANDKFVSLTPKGEVDKGTIHGWNSTLVLCIVPCDVRMPLRE